MVFANIEYLFLLLLLIPYIVWYIMKRRNNEATLQISDARVYAHTPKVIRTICFMHRLFCVSSVWYCLFWYWHVLRLRTAGKIVR